MRRKSSRERPSGSKPDGSKPFVDGFVMRSAFCNDSSKVRPMAITSPTDFIAEPMSRETRSNLARSQRGILTTM